MNLAPLFTRELKKHQGLKYNLYPSKVDRIFHTDTTDGRYIDTQLWEKYPLPTEHKAGTPVDRGEFKPSFSHRTIVVNYALGDIISYYDWQDDQYGVIAKLLPKKGGALADAHHVLKERVVADWFRTFAFATAGNNTPGSFDGRPLFDLSHPVSMANSGVTYANKPTSPVDLSISSYQAGASNLRQQFAANNTEIIDNGPRMLVVNPDLHYVASQILKGEWERGTADRNKNFIPDDSVDLLEWAYFRTSGATGTRNAWMLFGQEHQLNFYTRQEVEIMTDFVLNVLAYEFVSFCRFAFSADDWRGTYGSLGL